MADPADGSAPRGTLEQLVLAGLGGLALTAERIEGLATAIADRTGIAPAEARAIVEEQLGRWRGEAVRVAGKAAQLGRELGVASRDELDEVKLQLAQLDHRLRLLEKDGEV